MMSEFSATPRKRLFLKRIRKNLSVARHQAHMAGLFAEYVSHLEGEKYYYTYWLHNASTMLGVLKKSSLIQHYVSRAHSLDLFNQDWPLAGKKSDVPFHEFQLNTAALVAPVSKHGENYLRQRNQEMKEKANCFYLGVKDPKKLNPFAPQHFTIVSCSNFSLNKGLHRFVPVLKYVQHPVKWVIFGNGGDGSELLQKELKTLPVHIAVELKGAVPNEEVRAYYENFPVHLFINLSKVEGIPVSIMEAISYGIPSLATRVFGNPEIANDSTGFSVDYDFDPVEVADLLNTFIAEKELQVKKREGARRFFLETFEAEKNFNAFARKLLNYKN